jgi:hypothetical protein
MRFLDGTATTSEIKRLTGLSKKVRMAVAFWGDGATEGFCLDAKGKSATVICNLKSGGTNPIEIKRLIDNKVSVLQCDTLHGKVYLFDEHIILGSSNASANGLALQGRELSGWNEANIVTDMRQIYDDAERWFNELEVRSITPDDLEAAKVAFSKRRASPSGEVLPELSLIEAVNAQPESFKDKRIYLCVYLSKFDQAQIKLVEREKIKYNSTTVDAVGWQVPIDAKLVCFYVTYVKDRGRVKFEGFWERPQTEWKSSGKSPIYFMRKIRNIDGRSNIGSIDAWTPQLLAFCNAEIISNNYEAAHMELGDFYGKYLRETKTKS